jgi:hypothetical protein
MFSTLTRGALAVLMTLGAQVALAEETTQDACGADSVECTRVSQDETVEIDAHDECRLVTNRNAFPLMVAHKSPFEWSLGEYAFLTNPPPNTVIDICATWPTPNVLSFFASPFVDLSGVPTWTLVQSNIVTVTGFEGPIPVTVSPGFESEFRIRSSGTWTEWLRQGEINPGEELQLRHRSAGSNSGVAQTDVTIGSWSDDWKSTASTSISSCAAASVGGTPSDRGMFPEDVVAVSLFDGTGPNSFTRSTNASIPSNCLSSGSIPVWVESFSSAPVTNFQAPYAAATTASEFVGLSVNGSEPSPAVMWRLGQKLEIVIRNANGNSTSNFSIRANGHFQRMQARSTTQVSLFGTSHPERVQDLPYRNVAQWGVTDTVTLQTLDISEENAYGGIGMRSLDQDYWPVQGPASYNIMLSATYQSTRNCSVSCERLELQVQRGASTLWQTFAAGTSVTVSAGDRVRIRYLTGYRGTGGSRSMTGRILAGSASFMNTPVLTSTIGWDLLPTTFPASKVEPGGTVTSNDMPVAQIANPPNCVTPQVSASFPLSNPRMIVNGVDRGFMAQICNGDTLALRVSAASGFTGDYQVSVSGTSSGWTAKTWPVKVRVPIAAGNFNDATVPSWGFAQSNEVTISNLPPNTSIPISIPVSSDLSSVMVYAQGAYMGRLYSGSNTVNVTSDFMGNIRIYYAIQKRSPTGAIELPFNLGPTYDNFSRTWTIR